MTALPAPRRIQWALVALVVALAANTASAQTAIALPANSYTVADDVALGGEAATEARKRLPRVNDLQVNRYIEDMGRRLTDSIPADLRQPVFEYSFDVVNLEEISSVALPGGPIFISRGMIEVARSEGELAGVIAHQLSHVVLRHGTAQATRGERFQIGGILGRTIGAIVGGAGEGIVAQGANFGVSTYFLMYDRELEHQADLLAAQIMAPAGYDPRDIVTIFHTIKKEGAGRGGLHWMRSHPNPGEGDEYAGRRESVWREAETLRIEGSAETPGQFELMQQVRLAAIPAGHRADHAARGEEGGVSTGTTGNGRGVDVPSGILRSVTAGDSLLLSVPANWQRLSASNTVMFAPDRALANSPDGPALTHGVQVGVARSLTGSLENDTQALLESLGQKNPHLRWTPAYLPFYHHRATFGDRGGLTTTVSNVSPITGQFEQVLVSTGHLPDSSLLYVIGIAPQDEAGVYRNAFNRILESIQVVN